MVERDSASGGAVATVRATVPGTAVVFSAGNRLRPQASGLGGGGRCVTLVRDGSARGSRLKVAAARRRALVATYYEAELAGLVEHVADAVERYRGGELDVHDVDEVIHRY